MLPAMSRRLSSAMFALIAAAVLVGCGSDGTDGPGSTATSAAAPSPSPATPSPTGPADLAIQVTGPIGLATTGGDALWAVSSDQDAVVRIDPSTGQVRGTVEVGDTPLRMAADGDLLWVTVFRAGQVVAIDTASGEIAHTVRLGDGPEGVAVGHGAVWVVRQDAAKLTRLSKTGKVLGHTPLGEQPRLVAIGPDHVWVANFGAGTLTRIRPDGSGAKTTGKICDGAQGIAVGAGVVWVTCTTGDEVVAVDAATLRVRGRLQVEDEPDAIRLLDRHPGVVSTAGPTLVQIDPDPDAPAELDRIPLGDAPALLDQGNGDLTATGHALWVSSFGEDRVYRVRPD